MGKFSAMPVDVFPLVACVAAGANCVAARALQAVHSQSISESVSDSCVVAGALFIAHSAYRTTFQCGEVQYVSFNPCRVLMWLLSLR